MSFKKVLDPEWFIKFCRLNSSIFVSRDFRVLPSSGCKKWPQIEIPSNPVHCLFVSNIKVWFVLNIFPARSGYIQTLIFPEFSFSSWFRFYDQIHLFFFIIFYYMLMDKAYIYSIYVGLCLDRCLFMSHAANGNS